MATDKPVKDNHTTDSTPPGSRVIDENPTAPPVQPPVVEDDEGKTEKGMTRIRIDEALNDPVVVQINGQTVATIPVGKEADVPENVLHVLDESGVTYTKL